MGYETYYSLDIVVGDKTLLDSEEFQTFFKSTTLYDFDDLEDSIKWYEFDKDMLNISEHYPDTVFEIYGDGEESDDKWVSYWCNGISKGGLARIAYPKIDYTKLDNIGERCPELFI